MPEPQTRLDTLTTLELDDNLIAIASELLRRGQLVAFPTETVYGLGADATNPEALARIFDAKGRPTNNPLIVHVDSLAMAQSCVAHWPTEAQTLAEHFWPGPLTLVLPRSQLIPDLVTAGLETVGVRWPSAPIAQALIKSLGRPIAAPSANRSTGVSPTLASHVMADLAGKIDLILDGGHTTLGLESTVVDLTTCEVRVLRPGPINLSQIRAALGGAWVQNAAMLRDHSTEAATAPGQSPLHYSPRTPIELLAIEDLADWAPPSDLKAAILYVGHELPKSRRKAEFTTAFIGPDDAALNLYATLRAWDESNLDIIIVILPPDEERWRAIRDRLFRASGMVG
jgi:L-threonylcarbamoyladenylate synthase